jgi:isopropylmalate/homocitrate/citramalate synthase
MRLPKRVTVVDVGPRDGLQNEHHIVPTTAKLEFISALAAAGLREIEVGSFVRRDRVPQMGDTEQVVRGLDLEGPVRYAALVANRKGLERALAVGIRRIAVFTAASEAFARANIRLSIDKSLERFAPLVRTARRAGVDVRGYISTAWWCPFRGRVEPEAVERVAERLIEAGCTELSIADTIGAATPGEVQRLLRRLAGRLDLKRLAVHFHDTRGTALANVLAALQIGVTTIDASAGGLGGCPFAPGAQGNLATEDLLYMLDGLGVETGVDLEGVRRASRAMAEVLGRWLPSRYLQAGPPPRPSRGPGAARQALAWRGAAATRARRR